MSGFSDSAGSVAGRAATLRPDEKKDDGPVPADASPGAAADAEQAREKSHSKQ
jgi:hypothetical protein